MRAFFRSDDAGVSPSAAAVCDATRDGTGVVVLTAGSGAAGLGDLSEEKEKDTQIHLPRAKETPKRSERCSRRLRCSLFAASRRRWRLLLGHGTAGRADRGSHRSSDRHRSWCGGWHRCASRAGRGRGWACDSRGEWRWERGRRRSGSRGSGGCGKLGCCARALGLRCVSEGPLKQHH
jgi:hypothetical protein